MISSPSLMNSLTGAVRYVKLYGERHSGTKDIEDKLVKPRLRVLDSWLQDVGAVRFNDNRMPGVYGPDDYFRITFRQNLGWKHGEPPTPQELEAGSGPSCNDTLFLVTTRHPLDWIASLYERTYVDGWQPKSRHQPLRDFVRAPAPCMPRGNRDGSLSACAKPWDNPIRMWMAKVESYAALARRPGCAVHALRFGEHVANAQTAACALVLALPADVASLWSARAREECRLRQRLEQWNVRRAGFIQSPPRPAPG